MRRVAETAASAPPRTSGGALDKHVLAQIAPYVAFAAACYLVAPYLGLSSFDRRQTDRRGLAPGRRRLRAADHGLVPGRRVVWLTLAFMVLVFVVTAVRARPRRRPSLWMALVGVGQPLLMVWLYRRQLNHTGWAPESPREVASLLYATLASSVLLAGLGGFPGLNASDLSSEVLWWWVLRNTVWCFVGGVTFMVIFYGRRRAPSPPSPWFNAVGLTVAAFVCVYGSYHDPSLPLSWLLIIPSVWGGLTLTVRGTGYLALTVALAAASMSAPPPEPVRVRGPAACVLHHGPARDRQHRLHPAADPDA